MLSLSTIVNKFDCSDAVMYNESDQLYSVALRNSCGENLSIPHIISVLLKEEYSRICDSFQGAAFVIGKPDSLMTHVPTIVFPDTVKPDELVRYTNDILESHRLFVEYSIRLDTLCKNVTSIKEIFDLFAAYCPNPIVFGDCGGNVIMMDNLREDFNDWDESILYWINLGYVPYEYSKTHGNAAGSAKVQRSSTPVLMNTGYASKYHRLSYHTCRYNGVYNNYLCIVQVYEPFRHFDSEALQITGDAITNKFSEHAYNQIETPRNRTLKHLICDNDSKYLANVDRVNRFHIPQNGHFLLILLDFFNADTTENNVQPRSTEKQRYFKTTLDNLRPPVLNYADGERLIVLLHSTAKSELEKQQTRLMALLPSEVRAATSYTTSTIYDSPQLYKAAQLTLAIGRKLKPENNFFSFQELYFELLLSFLSAKESANYFILDEVQNLKNLDKTNGRDIYLTMEEYINCGKSLSALSAKLHIHKNTALYRINKAKEFLNIDLNNYENTMKLFLSFKLLRYLDLFNKGPV